MIDALPPASAPKADNPFRSSNTIGLPDLLESHGCCLVVSTYQAGKLMLVRGAGGRTATLLRTFKQPMGVAVHEGELAISTQNQIWIYRNDAQIAKQLPSSPAHDACFLPRSSHVTGNLRCHEMSWAGGELWFVNTLFSNLSTLHAHYSFVPRWRPRFIPELRATDACHLNGLAVDELAPRYVTALGESAEPAGWRSNRVRGGLLIDVPSGEVVCRGLSMPHSPRVYAGRVWVLESGTGQLQVVNLATGGRDTVAEVPGFARGLAFMGPYAFIGLSKIRETNVFGGLPISERHAELRCGIWVVDIRSGNIVEYMQFDGGVEEIFAVCVLAGTKFPELFGPDDEVAAGAFIIPPDPSAVALRSPWTSSRATGSSGG
jgi:uncharacterized protein (TIGR03032 family)